MKNKLLIAFLIILPLFNFKIMADTTYKPGVNKFAWYAALQTINFMPLLAADPFGGVILSDWYTVNNNERYKVDIYINEGLLTAYTVSVKVFKQRKIANAWVDDKATPSLPAKLEDAILTLARQLRIENNLTK